MAVETARMSSKGQIVIPGEIRKEVMAEEGTVFAVVGSRDTIVLKRIDTPSKESLVRNLESISREGRKRLEAKGIRESDIPGIVEKRRAN